MPAAFPIRSPRFDFSATPRWWHVDSRVATAMANGMNFVFPAGERFFIRSVRHFLDEVDDPELKARAAAFIGQEAQHQRGHMEKGPDRAHQRCRLPRPCQKAHAPGHQTSGQGVTRHAHAVEPPRACPGGLQRLHPASHGHRSA